jgi:hypothetical protein
LNRFRFKYKLIGFKNKDSVQIRIRRISHNGPSLLKIDLIIYISLLFSIYYLKLCKRIIMHNILEIWIIKHEIEIKLFMISSWI